MCSSTIWEPSPRTRSQFNFGAATRTRGALRVGSSESLSEQLGWRRDQWKRKARLPRASAFPPPCPCPLDRLRLLWRFAPRGLRSTAHSIPTRGEMKRGWWWRKPDFKSVPFHLDWPNANFIYELLLRMEKVLHFPTPPGANGSGNRVNLFVPANAPNRK